MLRKISLSSAAALLLTAQAFADTSSYRIITEYRNDKTYVFLNVLGEGESAAKKMLAIVKEKTGIDDAYYLPVRSKSKIKNKEKFVVPSYNFIDTKKHQEVKNEKKYS